MPSSGKVNIIDYDLLSEIDHEYEVCVGLTLREIAAIYQQVEYLGWRTRYDNPPDDTKILYEFAEGIQYKLLNAEGCDPANVCIEYPATAPFVEWIPAIGEPLPDTSVPVWEQGDISLPGFLETFKDLLNQLLLIAPNDPTVGQLLAGIEPTDVVTTISSYATAFLEDIANGVFLDGDLPNLPEFRVHLSGTGVCELHFVTLPIGSFIAYSLDRPIDLFTILSGILDFVLPDWLELDFELADTNRDLLMLPPEIEESNIKEIEITEEGDHTIYCMVIPAFNDSALLVDAIRLGGGLRKVVMCGNLCPQGVECRNEENLPIMTAADVTQGLKDFFCGCGCAGSGGSDDGTIDGLPPDADRDGDGVISLDERTFYDNSSRAGQIYRMLFELRRASLEIKGLIDQGLTQPQVEQFLQDIYGENIDAARMSNYVGLIITDGTVVTVDSPNVDVFGKTLFCRTGNYASNLKRAAYDVFVAAGLQQFLVSVDAWTNTQLTIWASAGTDQTRDDWIEYPCYLRSSTTLELEVIGGAGNVFARSERIDYPTETRLYEIKASGSATLADGTVIDALWERNAEGEYTRRQVDVGLTNSTLSSVIPVQTDFVPEDDQYPEPSPSGQYTWTRRIDYDGSGQFYFIVRENSDEDYDAGQTVVFTFTIRDLGESL